MASLKSKIDRIEPLVMAASGNLEPTVYGVIDREDIEDWAQNNMNWVDVKDFAIKLAHKVDYQDLWIEADFLGVDDE